MTMQSQPIRSDQVGESGKALIERYLALGNQCDIAFRKVCYAAAADKLNAYLLADEHDFSARQRDQFRSLLADAMEQRERSYGDDERVRTAAVDCTSLSAANWAGWQQTEAVAKEPDADTPQRRTRDGLCRDLLGFAAGLSIALMALVGLDAAGAIYVHANGESFAQLEQFNDSVRRAAPAVQDSLAVVKKVEERVKAAMRDGSLKHNGDVRKRFVPAEVLFPGMEAEIRQYLPPSSSLVVRIGGDTNPDGYKIVVASDLCPAVAALYPEKVDPIRAFNETFCRYYGAWDAEGKGL